MVQSHSHPEISGLHSRVSGVEGSVARLSDRVDGLEKRLLRRVGELQKTVDEFVSEYRHDRFITSARNDLAEARHDLEQGFGKHKEVRDLASGIIYVVKSGFISKAVILDVTERLAIKTPRYWLAPAILAVAAWLDGDKDRYVESIKTALALDHSKTALFMTLLLRHQARTQDMRDWIASYLAGLEPTNLPTDFAVVIEAVTGRTLGVDSSPQLVRRLTGWYESAASSRDAEDEEIGQWERNLMGLAPAGEAAGAFPALAKNAPDWELLRKRHEAATAIEAADEYFRGRFAEGADVPADLDEKISLLLKNLAEDADPAENRILQRIRRAEAVIETEDHAAAERRVAAEEADRARALNILSLVTRAAFPAGRRRAPTMTELLSIVMSQRFITAAAEKVHRGHQPPASVAIRLGERQFSFSCASDEETTTDALRRQADDHARELAAKIDEQTNRRRAKVRRGGIRRVIVGAVISVAFVLLALVPANEARALVVVLLAAAAFTAGYITLDWFVLLRARLQSIADNGSQEKRQFTGKLTQVGDELAALYSQQRRSADLFPGLQDYLLGLRADDAHRAIRFTSPPQALMLPGPDDSDSRDDDDPAQTRDDGLARGFPEWTPWPPRRVRQLPGPASPPG
ncbi:MAG: hypothetical protein ACRDPY_28775 [Streptosporangiaceae bacterium]